MRTLREIIATAQEGQPPSHEECFYAMAALSNLVSFSVQDWKYSLGVDKMKAITPAGVAFRAEKSFQRYTKALKSSPKEWLDRNDDPANHGYQKWRKVGNAIFDETVG